MILNRHAPAYLITTSLAVSVAVAIAEHIQTQMNTERSKDTEKMPAVTETRVAPKIIDPASEHGEEIDASIDRDRIRVVRNGSSVS